MSSRKNFSPARIVWRHYHRLQRICARESAKAVTDCMLFGTGFVRFAQDIYGCEHIPADSVQFPLGPGIETIMMHSPDSVMGSIIDLQASERAFAEAISQPFSLR